MRLINADALTKNWERDKGRMFDADYFIFTIEHTPTIDAIPVELVAEMFGNDEPCNFGLFGIPVDDFMCFECGDWCESNCDKVPAVECWKKFFEAWEERKDNG